MRSLTRSASTAPLPGGLERRPAQATKQDPALIEHESEAVGRSLDLSPHPIDLVAEPAAHHVFAEEVSGALLARVLSLARQPAGQVVDLARCVVVNLLKPE